MRIKPRIVLHRQNRLRSALQHPDDHAPGHATTHWREARIVVHGLQQHLESNQIVARAKVVGAGLSRHDMMELVQRVAELIRWVVAEIHVPSSLDVNIADGNVLHRHHHLRRRWQARTRWRSSSARSAALTSGVSAGRCCRSAESLTRLIVGTGSLSQSYQRP
jgi:hypothetical protein